MFSRPGFKSGQKGDDYDCFNSTAREEAFEKEMSFMLLSCPLQHSSSTSSHPILPSLCFFKSQGPGTYSPLLLSYFSPPSFSFMFLSGFCSSSTSPLFPGAGWQQNGPAAIAGIWQKIRRRMKIRSPLKAQRRWASL